MTEGMLGTAEPWGLYVHVPWCRVRCPYCSFAVVPHRGIPDWQPFVERVLLEIEQRSSGFAGPPATVFLGGGTPSRLPIEAIRRLLDGISWAPGAEVCAEANPEDIQPAWLEGAVAAGLDRLSLGVQTLDPVRAKLLGRAHTVKQARAAIAMVRAAGLRSWSMDLIFATPGQTLDDLDRDLDAVLQLEPPHVSLYGLTFEPGTAFDRARRKGRMVPLEDDVWRTMYERIVARLGDAGLQRYEVSNFARPGHRSRHNEGYWSDRPYLGAGPSAHGYAPDGTRWVDHADLHTWLTADDPTAELEHPTPEQRATDTLLSSLRGIEGVDLTRLAQRTGLRPDPQTLVALLAANLVQYDDDRLSLTDAGFPVCDAIVSRLSDGLRVQ